MLVSFGSGESIGSPGDCRTGTAGAACGFAGVGSGFAGVGSGLAIGTGGGGGSAGAACGCGAAVYDGIAGQDIPGADRGAYGPGVPLWNAAGQAPGEAVR